MPLIEDAKSLVESIEYGARNTGEAIDCAAYRLAKAYLAEHDAPADQSRPSETLRICAKCGDMCQVIYPNGEEADGYVPRGLGIGGGDYIDLEIDIATGKLVDWDKQTRDRVLEFQEKA